MNVRAKSMQRAHDAQPEGLSARLQPQELLSSGLSHVCNVSADAFTQGWKITNSLTKPHNSHFRSVIGYETKGKS